MTLTLIDNPTLDAAVALKSDVETILQETLQQIVDSEGRETITDDAIENLIGHWDFHTDNNDTPDDAESCASFTLVWWLENMHRTGIDANAVIGWVNTHFTSDWADVAGQAGGLIGYRFAPEGNWETICDDLIPDDFNEALLILAAGAIATNGGTAAWIRQFDPR